MVSARNFVKGKAGTIVIIAGIVLGGAYLAKRFNVGSSIISDIQGLGNITGQALIAPFSGIVSGTTQGTEALAGQLGASQEALFHQFCVIQDNFNKFIHPDWYNPDGSYSSTNPNFGKSQSCITTSKQNTTQPGNANLPTTTPNPPNPPLATNNKANILTALPKFAGASFGQILAQTGTASRVTRSTTGYNFATAGGTVQPIGQGAGLTKTGAVSIGAVGLSQSEITRDVTLSKKLGGPVFDVQGNIVAINGVRLAR